MSFNKMTYFNGLNICVPPKCIWWNLNAHVMVLGGGFMPGAEIWEWIPCEGDYCSHKGDSTELCRTPLGVVK